MLEQDNDTTLAWVFSFSSPSCPTPSNVGVTVPVHRVPVVTPVPTVPVSVIENTIQPCIDPPAFKDDSELKANIRKFIVQFLDPKSGVVLATSCLARLRQLLPTFITWAIVSRGQWLGRAANFKGQGYCSILQRSRDRLPAKVFSRERPPSHSDHRLASFWSVFLHK